MKTHNSVSREIVGAIAVILLAGCTAYLPHVNVDDKPVSSDAYVYGRFTKRADSGGNLPGGAKGLVLVLRCDDGKKHLFKFSEVDPLKLLKVTPSVCLIDEFVFLDFLGAPRNTVPFSDAVRKVELSAGKAYYIGDFAFVIMNEWNPIFARMYFKSIASDNYESTTRMLRDTYPNFSSIPTENRSRE
jgi:hypothetical protein